jgi:tartrate-resistant acid phosphatase type 5
LKRLLLLLAVAALPQCKRRVPEPAPPSGRGPTAVISDREPSRANPSAVDARGEPASSAQPPDDGLPPDAGAGAVRFAVIGDYGASTAAAAAVAALVKSWRPEFLVTLGDNNYPSGEAATIDINVGQFYAEFIGDYRGRFGPGSAKNRFWPSPGNHDWVVGLAPYLDYFNLPGNERYYDVELGIVHLFALDSDVHEPDGISPESKQAAWLKQRLETSKACYDVVYFHHPAYSTADHGPTLAMRWPFQKWGAEVVLAGHDHTYERFEVDGIPYFVNGLGGASRYEFPTAPIPETRFRYNEEFGAMRVTATRTQITYEFFTIDRKKRDAFTAPANCRR